MSLVGATAFGGVSRDVEGCLRLLSVSPFEFPKSLPTRSERLNLSIAILKEHRELRAPSHPATPTDLYNFQLFLHDAFRLYWKEEHQEGIAMVLSSANALSGAFTKSNAIEIFGLSGRKGWSVLNLQSSRTFLMQPGTRREATLEASQFLGFVSETLNLILDVPSHRRTDEMNKFLQVYLPLVSEHLERWAYLQPGQWQNVGYGCALHSMTSVDYMVVRTIRKDIKEAASYCNSFTDTDAWLTVIALEFIAISRKAPAQGLNIPESARTAAQLVAQAGLAFFDASISTPLLRTASGGVDRGLIVDLGQWATHPEYEFSGWSGEFPNRVQPQSSANVSWDLAHSGRLVTLLLSAAANSESIAAQLRYAELTRRFSNQLGYAVYNGSPLSPLFANFIDGSNGWYRVNYSGRVGFGYPPYSLSVAMYFSPYMRLARLNPRLYEAAAPLWAILTKGEGSSCVASEAYRTFELENYVLQPSQLDSGLSLRALPFVSSVPVKPD